VLTVGTWVWGDKYGPEYMERLEAGLRRHLTGEYRFRVFRPDREDMHLTGGCLVRLRMFDPAWQARNGIGPEDRLACIDLDVVVTGSLDPLFERVEPFVILHGGNSLNPCPFNGSLMMLRGGAYPEAWSDLSEAALKRVKFYAFPDDQGWLAHKVPHAAGWKVGQASGVYAFRKPGWPGGDDLPGDARLVVFPGWRDPQAFQHLSWVKQHWSA
jgi:hypothetical protein